MRMGASTPSKITASDALSQVHLSTCTPHIAVPGWTTASSKGSRPRRFYCSQIPQLMAHNCSICKVPVVITHSAPMAKEEDLNTPLLWTGPSHQSDSTFCCSVIQCVIYMYMKWNAVEVGQGLELLYYYIGQRKLQGFNICFWLALQ